MQDLNDWEILFVVGGCEHELEITTLQDHANQDAYEEHIEDLNNLMDKVDPEKAFRNGV